MVAAWLFEFLRRERDWRAVLRKVASQLSELPDERVRAALDVGVAFEHLEPDRRHAINAYQLAGLGHDRGRSRAIAQEMGWLPAVARLGQLEARAGLGIEPLVAACRALIDLREVAEARRLGDAITLSRDDAGDPRLAGIRAELDDRHGEWVGWVAQGREMTGAAAAERFVIAARLARGAGREDWRKHLEAALVAEPGHAYATATLTNAAFSTKDSNAVIEVLRVITANLEVAPYVDTLRALATRLVVAGAGRGGLTRRLLQTALERAYTAGMTEINGHLAMWHLVATAAADDGRSAQLLPHVMRGMNAGVPVVDRTWLAALGATICVEAGDRDAGRAWAAVVAEHAPSHPVVRELLAATEAQARDAKVDAGLADIELDAAIVVPIPDLAPKDDAEVDLGLARATSRQRDDGESAPPAAPDPRFVDTRVRALDEDDRLPRTTQAKAKPVPPPAPAPAAAPAAPTPAAAPKPTPASASVDDAWDIDEQIFPAKRRPTTPPRTVAKPAVAVAAPLPAKPVPAAVTPNVPTTTAASGPSVTRSPSVPAATPTPAASPAPPSAASPAPSPAPLPSRSPPPPPVPSTKPGPLHSLIPNAALQVLKSAGAPRSLPKLVPPNAIARAPRAAVAVDVRLRHRDREVEVHTRDFSATGFFAVTTASFTIGDVVDCDVRLPAPSGLAEQTFATRAKVVRRELAGYGLVLENPPPTMVAAITALATPE